MRGNHIYAHGICHSSDGITALDFIGAYDPLTRLHTMNVLPDVTWHVCATNTTVRDGAGLRFVPESSGSH